MKKFRLMLWMQLLMLPLIVFSSFSGCEKEEEGNEPIENPDTEDVTPDGGTDVPSKDTTDIAVTGLVDVYGCTYADISGYANLHQLPAGSSNPVIGVEINDGLYTRTTSTLEGNHFSVSFNELRPGVEYKYRSFVKYAGIIHYAADYRIFITKSAYSVASTGDASDVTYGEASVTAYVQATSVDIRDSLQFGVAYSVSASALHPDSVFDEVSFSMNDVENGEYTVTLTSLSDNTTYYYAAYTSFNGVYVFSDVKNFTTEEIQTAEIINGHEWIDLGLPSGLKWATCNVGASVPEGYGGYYAWGETEEKSNYTEETYQYARDLDGDGNYWDDSNNWINIGSNISGTQYDVAHVKWGSSWRMPTLDEIKELVNNCSWKWTTLNGVNGQLVTGPNGNSIFLPAAGYRVGTDFDNRGSDGSYWSATLYEDFSDGAYSLYFYSGFSYWDYLWYRYNGHTVRPVTE